jgi:hypothetical protein
MALTRRTQAAGSLRCNLSADRELQCGKSGWVWHSAVRMAPRVPTNYAADSNFSNLAASLPDQVGLSRPGAAN